jgi:hypothetical protein
MKLASGTLLFSKLRGPAAAASVRMPWVCVVCFVLWFLCQGSLSHCWLCVGRVGGVGASGALSLSLQAGVVHILSV